MNPAGSDIEVSFVVPTYNGRDLLACCLPALQRAADRSGLGERVEIVVVDDASADETADYLRRRWPAVRTIRLETNAGFAAAANAGIRAARGRWVAMVNNDVTVADDWLRAARPHLDQPGVGAIATRILQPSSPPLVESDGDEYTVAGVPLQSGRDTPPSAPAGSAPTPPPTPTPTSPPAPPDERASDGAGKEAPCVSRGRDDGDRTPNRPASPPQTDPAPNAIENEAPCASRGTKAPNAIGNEAPCGSRGTEDHSNEGGERTPLVPDRAPPPRRCFSGCGAAVLYRREALDEVGPFCEDLQAYYEDVELGFRLNLRGWTCVHEPRCMCVHRGSASYGRGSFRQKFNSARNAEAIFFTCMPRGLLLRYLPAHLLADLLLTGHHLLRGTAWAYLRGKLAFLARLGWAIRRRREVQALRVVPSADLRDRLVRPWLRALLAQHSRSRAARAASRRAEKRLN